MWSLSIYHISIHMQQISGYNLPRQLGTMFSLSFLFSGDAILVTFVDRALRSTNHL